MNRETNAAFEKTVRGFPIRFGRDPYNDIALEYPFVSKFHALVDLRAGRLFVRDLGSRNGTSLISAGEALVPNEPVEVTANGNTFAIGSLVISLRLTQNATGPEDAQTDEGPLSSITGRPMQTRVGPATSLPKAVEARVLGDEIEPLVEAYRKDWDRIFRALSERIGVIDPPARAHVLADIANRYGLTHEPDFQRLSELNGIRAESQGEAAKALNVLRELSEWYLGRPVQTESDIEAFGKKLRRTLDEFLLSFVPLRSGSRRVEADLGGIGRVSGAQSALDAAQTPAEVAAALLDWRNPADTARALRSIFSDIMAQPMGLVSGVMKGAFALLDQLAPARIEDDVKNGKHRGTKRFSLGPWRFGVLWDEYARRHGDFALEEEGTFAVIFGREFGSAYRELFSEVSPKTVHGAAPSGSSVAANAKGSTVAYARPTAGPTGTKLVQKLERPSYLKPYKK